MAIDDGNDSRQLSDSNAYELGIGGLVGQTIVLWFRKFPQYFLIVLALGILSTAIQSIILIGLYGFYGIEYLQFIGTSPLDSVFSLVLTQELFPINLLVVLIVLSIVSMVIYSIVAGAVIKYALVDYKHPGTADVRESFSYAISRAPTLIGAQLIVSAIIIGVASLVFVVAFFDYLVSLVLIFLVLYLAVKLTPTIAIVIAEEEQTAFSAVSKSWELTGRVFWHVFLAQLLLGIVLIIFDILVGLAFSISGVVIFGSFDLGLIIGTIVSSIILSPVNYVYLGVLYKDLESRKNIARNNW